MALKKVRKPQVSNESNTNQKEVTTPMSIVNNYSNNENQSITVSKEEAFGRVDNTLENVMNEHTSNHNVDSFFNSEELSDTYTPLTNLEIEIEAECPVDEGRYQFVVKNVGIERQVAIKYGLKDKLILEFHISRIRDEQEFAYDLKQKYNISRSYKSRFYEVYKDLTGEAPRGKINLGNLLGAKGYCEIKHISLDNGDIFPRIVNINAQIYKDSSEVSEA